MKAKENGLTQETALAKSGISTRTASRIEGDPEIGQLAKIRWMDYGDDDEGSTGTSLVPVPRQPCPNPMNTEVNAPQD